MVKKYTNNYRLDIAYATVFRNIEPIENIPIHEILDISSGDNLTKSNIITGPHIVYGGGGTTNKKHNKYNIDYKTVGIGRVGARCGCVFEIQPNSWVTDNALIIKSFDKRFSLDFIRHFLSFSNLGQFANNSMQPVISKMRIKHVLIPLIPLEEQERLSKVLEAIENNIKIKNTEYKNLVSKIEIIDNWEKLNYEIDCQKNLITQLKTSILQDAIQGKLTTDWRNKNKNTEPASELLKRIKTEKAQLIKDNKIKKENTSLQISKGEIPFEVPETWVWCRLIDLCSHISDIDHNMPKAVEDGVKFLSAKDLLNDGTLNFSKSIKYISEEDFQRLSRKILPKRNDIIYSRIGANLGKARIVETDEKFIVSYSCCTIRTLLPNVKFLNMLMDSSFVLRQATTDTTSHSIPDLGMGKIKAFKIPLPSVKEQQVIVEKAETMMQKLQALEQEIKTSEANAQILIQAILKESFESEKKGKVEA